MSKRKANQRPQKPKSKERVGEAFTVFRPLTEESADSLYQILRMLDEDGYLPLSAVIKPPEHMRVTYIERRNMSKQLQGFAAGFNAAEAVQGINDVATTREQEIDATIGRVGLMDRRNQTVVAQLSHNQVVGEEYQFMHGVLSALHMPQDRRAFKPHISLVTVSGVPYEQRRELTSVIAEVLPDDVVLAAMQTFPLNPGHRRPR